MVDALVILKRRKPVVLKGASVLAYPDLKAG